ncbi:hypothetical protein GE115_08920 [Agromyces sp. CFH 90414]|uniref:Uncharacterized protein n=1 Tax=Agromyces agglutinans TaxID=2662258 RepID=A0A6I2FGA2_9MICO|nr:hypothetical protein [Agromyces agglutinans]MRG59988.1 hypothetical protein [Agromyces agglutinans]
MTDAAPDPDLDAEARALAAHVIDPFRWHRSQGRSPRPTASDIEFTLFRARGLGAEADRIWHSARGVSDAAGRQVGRIARARYGVRSPRGGLIPIVVLLLTIGMTAPLVLLGIGYRGHSLEPRPEAGAFWTAIIGGAMFVAALVTIGRPVPRPTFFQSQVVCVVLGGFATVWVFVTDDPAVRVRLIVGIAALVLTVVIFWVGRLRDPAATAAIDAALDDARAEAASGIPRERERLKAELAAEFADRDDCELLRRARTIAIETLHAEGNAAEDTAPDSAPGAYIIEQRTSDWMPRPQPKLGRRRTAANADRPAGSPNDR